jgi:hypothetical protein
MHTDKDRDMPLGKYGGDLFSLIRGGDNHPPIAYVQLLIDVRTSCTERSY